MARARITLIPAAAWLCTACAGWQSALAPRGVEAQHLTRLIWLFIAVCSVVWIAVMLVLAGALLRRNRATHPGPDCSNAPADRTSARIVGVAVLATALIITGLTIVSFYATRGLASGDSRALDIRVRGYQWWWEVTYLDAHPHQVFSTANEIHIPVGRPVHIQLAAADVIHSFWVPNLTGKQDLIPGRENSLTFTARRLGVYRGQCAEFCGLQHAHMAFLVIVDDPAAFEHWRTQQLTASVPPRGARQQTGKQLFESKPCAACHTIQGSLASGSIGPDLTHLASRRYIAAGLLPTNRGTIAAWIADPQTLKPGNNMPRVPLTADELNALCAYLADLQ